MYTYRVEYYTRVGDTVEVAVYYTKADNYVDAETNFINHNGWSTYHIKDIKVVEEEK